MKRNNLKVKETILVFPYFQTFKFSFIHSIDHKLVSTVKSLLALALEVLKDIQIRIFTLCVAKGKNYSYYYFIQFNTNTLHTNNIG